MGFFDFFFGSPTPLGFKWDNQHKDLIVTSAKDANAGVAGSPYSAGDKVNPETGKVIGGKGGGNGSSDVTCPDGYELRSGLCYPIDCGAGFVFDPVFGACVTAPEASPEPADDGADKAAQQQIKALEKQLAKLAKSDKAEDKRAAQQLAKQKKQLEAARKKKPAKSPAKPVQPVRPTSSGGPSALETYGPYVGGAAAIGLGIFLYRNR